MATIRSLAGAMLMLAASPTLAASLTLAASGALAQPAPPYVPRIQPGTFQPETPAPIVITPDNVELTGIAGLEFTPDQTAFHVNPPPGGDAGTHFSVRLWVDAAGMPLSCDVGQSPDPAASATACRQAMRSARVTIADGFALPLRRGFLDVTFSFFSGVGPNPSAVMLIAHDDPSYHQTTIVYPPLDIAPTDRLDLTGGHMTFAAADVYPSMALRYGYEGRSGVAVAVGRDGRVARCRPTSSSGTAYLDNVACQQMLRFGRFAFNPTAPDYPGLRWFRQSLMWKIPRP